MSKKFAAASAVTLLILAFQSPALAMKPGEKFGLFTAEGLHTCQSKTSRGHTCKVSGSGFKSCPDGQISLKSKEKSCCAKTPEGGTSIGFRLTTCSTIRRL